MLATQEYIAIIVAILDFFKQHKNMDKSVYKELRIIRISTFFVFI